MDRIDNLANYVTETRFEDLSPETVEATKKLILDGLAVALGGSSREGVFELLDCLRESGGKPESTVWVFGDRMPAVSASQVNAMMMHALDYDDVYDKAVLHCGVVAIPVALAMAERLGGVSGKDIITAVAVGSDICARLTLAVTISVFELGWHYTTLHGNFNAAATAGKLMHLNTDEMVNAFGLAYHQAGGNYQSLHDGSLGKRIGPAFASRDGIMAALLAQRGVTGPRNIIDGKAGLYKVYHRGHFDPDILLNKLGTFNELRNLSLKPYPCCRGVHPSIDGALNLAREHHLTPDEIDQVRIQVGKGIFYLVCEPVLDKQNPKTIVDAQFSIPWAVGWALKHGRVGMSAFTAGSIKDPEVLALSNKVFPEVDGSLQSIGLSPAVVTVRTKDGRVLTSRIDKPYGAPETPMSMEDIRYKMLDCADLSAKKFSNSRLDDIVRTITSLELLEDAAELVGLLQP